MKKTFIVLLCLLPAMVLSGCMQKNSKSSVRVVTGIHISAKGEGLTVDHDLTQDETMSTVLNYIRLLDPYVTVELDPETFRSENYEIIVTYSDGNHTVYRQIYQDYFQENNGNWKRIDPKLGSRLHQLINDLPEQL